jgi:hypothetical protein
MNAGRAVGGGAAPFVIAEMSGNHNQSLDRARCYRAAAARSRARESIPPHHDARRQAGEFSIRTDSL